MESKKTTNEKMDDQNPPNIGSCGIYQGPGGSVTAQKIKITMNPPPAVTEQRPAATKFPFRFNILTPNKHFKGRAKILEAVWLHFNSLPVQTDDCWERIVAIVGRRGMGKTEIARKFADEFDQKFPSVAWINAETEKSALASFLGIAKCLKLVPSYQKEADLKLVRQVYSHIDEQDYGSTLFIFDNAIRLNPSFWKREFGIYEYLPTYDLENKRFPNVLITTKTQYWDRGIKTIQVDKLSAEESMEFFRSTFHIQSTECDNLFKKLHKLLEGFPAAMILAASQIDYSPNSGKVDQLKEQIQCYILREKQASPANLYIVGIFFVCLCESIGRLERCSFANIFIVLMEAAWVTFVLWIFVWCISVLWDWARALMIATRRIRGTTS